MRACTKLGKDPFPETPSISLSEQLPIAPASSVGRFADGLTPGRFSLLLGLLMLAFFPDVIFGAKTFFFRDYALFGYPLAHYHREAFWRGEIPLWNPLNNCGIPFLAQWNTMVFYPGSLVYLLLPLPWSLGWFCLLHLFVAGLGMYYLAYRWTENRLGASVAGVAFAFSGLTLSCLIWPGVIAAMAWVPWLFLWTERGWTRGRGDLLKAAFIGAVQMLSGTPEVILFTWMFVTALWAWQFCNSKVRLQIFGRFALIILLVAALSAVQLFPFLDFLRHSHRGGNGGTTWSMPPWGWANFLVPLFRATESPVGVFLQPTQGWLSSYYLGMGVCVLALAAIWKVRQPRVYILGLFLVFSLIISLGHSGYAYTWLQKLVPNVGFMHYPVKLVIFAGWAVPILTAFAIAHWQTVTEAPRREFRLVTIFLCSACLLLVAAILLFSFRYPGEEEDPRATFYNGLLRGALLLVVIGAFYAAGKITAPRLRIVSELALVLAVWADLVTHAPRQNPTVDAQAYQIRLPPLAEMQPRPKPGESRALLGLGTIAKFHTTIISNSFEAMLGFRLGLYDDCNLLEGMPKVDGFYPLYIPEEQHVRFNVFTRTNTVRRGLADFLGVSQVTLNFLEWQSRSSGMPMMTTGQRPEFADPDTTLDSLASSEFDPRKVVYLPIAAKGGVTVASNPMPARIVSQEITPHRIRAELEAAEPTMLVLAQTFYHPWKAMIDGHPAALWRANYAFQAVEIPSGRHRVEFLYRDRSFTCGATISGLTALGCFGWALFCRRRWVDPVQ